jgi:hypothetical protein
MTDARLSNDLVVLTACKNAQFTIQGLLTRFKSLGIRELSPDYFIHPGKDPGVWHNAHNFLRSFSKTHDHALVMMDREGSGQEDLEREEMETQLEQQLGVSGWDDRAAAVVIEPELDIWVWSDSPHVDHELGWANRQPDLRTWLREQTFLAEGEVKPVRPKEALEAALRQVRKPRSSAIYKSIATKVSLVRCIDPAFGRLKTVLQEWFNER